MAKKPEKSIVEFKFNLFLHRLWLSLKFYFHMINRRHIRIKVMQSLYAMLQSKNEDIVKEEKFLKFSIQKLFDLYVLNLNLIAEIQKQAEKKIALAKKKILATSEDLAPNTRFVDNTCIHKIRKSEALKEFTKKYKLENWDFDDEYVKIIYDELVKSDMYQSYLKAENVRFEDEKEFTIQFFKSFIAPNEKLAEYYEDKMITWVDDIPFVNTWIVKSLGKMNYKKDFALGRLYKDEDDENFVKELFTKTILKHTDYENDIAKVTPNWDSDRIADIDMILIKMAITEFLHFPSIPTKVTINEYIEIAKDYSTDKSSYFLNGVLDKLAKNFKKNNQIQKIGRGLL
tara:strand:+ start:10257 stop:11285 length:1029 start_codon:yes stop_codon:yes gene_type:complete